MTRFISRVRFTLIDMINTPSPSFLEAVFNGGHADSATSTADHGAAVRAGSRIDRLRSQRRDLAAALRADAGQPERELTVWPPAVNHRVEPCQVC